MNWTSLPELHRSVSVRLGPKPALRYKRQGTYRDLNWSTYRRQADEAAAGLIGLGIEPGDRVAMLSENRYEWLIADHAILSTGAVTMCMHAPLSAVQVAYQLRHSGSRGIIVSGAEQAGKVFEVLQDLPDIEFLISFDPIDPDNRLNCMSWEGLKSRGCHTNTRVVAEREDALVPGCLASILYTSGTTGDPKGVMLSHGNILSNVKATLQVQDHRPTDILLSWLPYSHIYARVIDHYLTTLGESLVCLAESFDALRENLSEVKPMWMTAVPRFYEKIWTDVESLADEERNEELHRIFGPRLRHFSAGGAPLPVHVAEGFAAAGLYILQGYGLTETSPVISFNPFDNNRIGTVGPPVPGVEVRIAEDGEILTKGPHVMQGYWKNPEATAETIVDGWLYTGDIGELDADGFLIITDRKKDLIITSGGKNIAPGILERLLCTDTSIDQAVVYGDRKKFVTALIVPNFEDLGRRASELGCTVESVAGFISTPELLEFIDGQVSSVMRSVSQPERVRKCLVLDRAFSVDENELTATLKVRRRHITEKYSLQLEALYEKAVPEEA